MQIYLTKTMIGLIPSDEKSREWFDKIKLGEAVHADFKKVRNYRFLKKYFALLNIAFDHWEPGQINSKYGTPEKNFDRFRADVTILAGYYESTIRLDGSVRIEPKSISFARMSESEFKELYSKTIDVLIKHVYGSKMTPEAIEETVKKYLEFL
jgi:hypothetical protein